MPDVVLGHFSGTLGILAQKGVRYSTVIDLGCADGFFYLQHFDMGLLPGSIVVNVDANAMYEPSLREIREVLGGHYAIAAISDSDGEVELRTGSHPYWAFIAADRSSILDKLAQPTWPNNEGPGTDPRHARGEVRAQAALSAEARSPRDRTRGAAWRPEYALR